MKALTLARSTLALAVFAVAAACARADGADRPVGVGASIAPADTTVVFSASIAPADTTVVASASIAPADTTVFAAAGLDHEGARPSS